MASTVTRKEAAAYRHDYILESLKNHDGTSPIPIKDLAASLLVSPGTVTRELKKLKEEFPDNVKSVHGGRHAGYYWKHLTMPSMVIPENKVIFDRYPITKNDEGYPDPTAALAIMNTEGNQMFGEIYDFKNTTGYAKFLVIASTESHVTGCVLYESYNDIAESEKPSVVKITVGEDVWFYNPKRIFTKPAKYCLDVLGRLNQSDRQVLSSKIKDYLGLEKEDTAHVEALAIEAANNKVRCDDLLKEAERLRKERDILKADNKALEENLNDILSKRKTDTENTILQWKVEIYEDLIDRLFPRPSNN